MECRYYQLLEDGRVECQVCPHHCKIAEGKRGLCGSRRHLQGKLVSEVYGKPCALAIDPIEKKPLYHFHPGTTCLSLACTGCNFRCLNCQNHDISQAKPEEVPSYELQPEALIELCQKHHCPGIAYTYTEPLTYIEYVIDTARLAHEAGLWNILVTAGYVVEHPRDSRLCVSGTTDRPVALSRCGEYRPEIIQRRHLPTCEWRTSRARASDHPRHA